jgi:hypothetical protein
MKGNHVIRVAWAICLWMGLGLSWTPAQPCYWPTSEPGAPSLLALLTDHAGPERAAPPIISDPNDSLGPDERLSLFVAGEYAAASKAFRQRDTSCGYPILRLAADYAVQYKGTTPFFPGFNGGFYNFLKDSLQQGEKLNLSLYNQALEMLHGWVRFTNAKSPVALELYGDLLYRHPDRLLGNYFGALVYLKAGLNCTGPSKDSFFEKAAYALESPADVRRRFDMYRFTQIRKALEADIANKDIQADPAASLSVVDGKITYISPQDGGSLLPMLKKAREATLEIGPKTFNKYGQEVDARKVKADTGFNLYALLLIGTVLGAIAFFWYKIRAAMRK